MTAAVTRPVPRIVGRPAWTKGDEDPWGVPTMSITGVASWGVGCCGAGRFLRRGYRTAWRAQVVLADHLAVEHGVHIAPARIAVSLPEICSTCRGLGWTIDDIADDVELDPWALDQPADCPDCDGDGWTPGPPAVLPSSPAGAPIIGPVAP